MTHYTSEPWEQPLEGPQNIDDLAVPLKRHQLCAAYPGFRRAERFIRGLRLPQRALRVGLHTRWQLAARSSLLLDLHALPEGDVVFDRLGGGFRFRVVPGRIGIALAVYLNVVVAGQAFPRAGGVLVARAEEFRPDGVGREVLVSLDFDGAVALCQNCVFPDCFCHDSRLDS